MRTLDGLELGGKRVFVRVDFNVPLDKERRVKDDMRVRAVLPTVRRVTDQGGIAILASHLGRPKGKVVEEMSLKPVSDHLAGLLDRSVPMLSDCIGDEVLKRVSELKDGDAVLLENLRFHPGEEKNDDEFSKRLAALADVYVNDAFAVSHRAHASVHGITRHVKVCAAGYQLAKEVEYFQKALENPQKPIAVVIGGAKISTKIGLLENLIPRVDYLLIGGAMANTFLKAQGKSVGKSLAEDDYVQVAAKLLKTANEQGVKVFLPVDVVVASSREVCGDVQQVTVENVPPETQILDVGTRTVEVFKSVLTNCPTVVWNGPLGVFETSPFHKGTYALAEFLGGLDALTVIGGGDSAAAVRQAGVDKKVSYVSTGGGAFLEMLEGKTLPGIDALEKCEQRS